MPDLTVDADLLVDAPAGERQLRAGDVDGDFGVNTTGAAKQATLASILAALTDGDEASSLAMLTAIRTAVEDLAADDEGIAREGTLASILTAVDGLEGLLAGTLTTNVTDRSGRLLGHVTVDNPTSSPETGLAKETTLATRATEATLIQVRDYLDTVETKLQAVADNTDGLEGFTDGIEVLLGDLKTYTDGVEGLLTTIRDNADTLEASFATLNGKDFATQTTLAAVLAAVDGLEGVDYATNAKLEAVRALLAGTLTIGLPAGASTAANQATGNTSLASILTSVDGVEGLLAGNLKNIEQDAGQRTQFDYYTPAGSSKNQIRYFGAAAQGTADAGSWIVKRLTWTHYSDDDHIVDLQTLTGAWADRATLGWT